MKESEFQITTNLARPSVVAGIMRNVILPDPDLVEKIFSAAMAIKEFRDELERRIAESAEEE
jgi:hypothetical protein